MTPADSELVEGAFVIARIGQSRFAIDIAHVAEVLPIAGGDAGIDVERIFGIEPPPRGERMRIRLQRRDERADLDVPADDLEIGRRLRGPRQAPLLVAAALERCCLEGVVKDEDGFFYLLDLGRFWSRFVEPSSSKGEST